MIVQRPGSGTEGRVYVSTTNFRSLRLRSGCRVDVCYTNFEPDLPDDSKNLRVKILERNRVEVVTSIKCEDFICTGGNVYLLGGPDDFSSHTFDLAIEGPQASNGNGNGNGHEGNGNGNGGHGGNGNGNGGNGNGNGHSDEGNGGNGGNGNGGAAGGAVPGRYRVTITAKKELRIVDERCLTEEQRMYFNIILNKALREANLQPMGRFYYNPSAKFEVANCSPPLQLFPGYFTSVTVTESGLTMMSDVKHRILQSQFASDVMEYIAKQNPGASKEQRLFYVIEALKGKVVMTRHTLHPTLYRVEGVDGSLTIDSTFKQRNGEEISFRDYFKKQYNQDLAKKDMPLLIAQHRKKRTVFLPAELCMMTGLTDKLKSDFRVMTAVAAHTRMIPKKRFEKNDKLVELLQENPKSLEVLHNWGLEIGSSAVEAEGRQVDQAHLRVMTRSDDLKAVEDGKGVKAGQDIDFQRINFPHLIQRQVVGFQRVKGFQKWVVIHQERDKSLLDGLKDSIGEQLQTKKMGGQEPKVISISAMNPADFVASMLEEMKKLPARPDIILVILPRGPHSDAFYAKIKEEFCTGRMACPTQCIKADTLQKKGAQAAAKLFDQMICKQGGFLWGVNAPHTQSKRTMVVGVDVNSTGGKAIAGFSASFNCAYTKYYSATTWMKSRDDVAQPLVEFMKRAIGCFKDSFEMAKGPAPDKKYPDRIVIYRDGMGESQKQLVRDFEIAALQECFRGIETIWAGTVEVVYIVVNKMIHQRFAVKATKEMLPRAPRGGGRGGRGGGGGAATIQEGDLTNAQPLTVFDNTVVSTEKFDFFISHQEVTQGSVTPTHYDVLFWNNRLMSVDDVQRLTAQLSMLYQNWPGPIRVPAPVMYATKQCALYSLIKSKDAVNKGLPYMLRQLYFL
uniref:Piwi domain-containing protein n=1 Tax=Chromera velia CCMP2878 TaxID=1169474 RepID=A0A0G4FCF4_9ALVE|eukprot:Cvel_16303.t1-p1 / transcript=Cvel_16303.t1 / gene=Cvel_16303 / organism=Chromera_velia_CCMP2878 / gene_product=Piwi-like protein 1, putative / transcript_product=Piwi-like protein 1, putative / location=Cvel_scaffold1251:17967-24362(-) / protein_length=901 / sequence_SO=supercontig / SO=protein_coding / is_pseudo=false